MADKIRAAIIGGSEAGKTALAIGFSRWFWREKRIASIVHDPFKQEHDWGPQAWVTDDMDVFERVAFSVNGFAVFWDEGTDQGRNRDKVKFFTAIRHNSPAFFFIGHAYSTMLPVMRGSLTDLYLFRRDYDDAKSWSAQMTDEEIMRSTGLGQYQYLHKRAFRPVGICSPSYEQIKRGVSP